DRVPDAIYKELNGIDRTHHRQIRQTEGTKRVTSSLKELTTKYDLSPRSHDCPVYFGQANVQMQFSQSGKFRRATLDDVATMLKAGEISPDEIPVRFLWVDGKRVTVNNRSLTVLYKAGMRPTRLIDQSEKLPVQGPGSLEEVLRRLEAMAGKPSTEMLVRTPGIGSDGRPREARDWEAPMGEIVSMPDDVLAHARSCDVGAPK
ncbi:MAG TPA: hypothetical protein VFM35_03500, partial [Candidatus Binatia bacterium]|nr:hypothetical protein [Candidatus Binatia bacterium]